MALTAGQKLRASELNALVGEIGALPPRTPTFLNGWGNLGSTSWDTLKVTRDGQGVCDLAGDVVLTPLAAVAAGVTVIIGSLPTNYRPRRTAIRHATIGGATQPSARFEVRANGDLALIAPTGGIPAGEYVAIDCSWVCAAAQTVDVPATAT